MAANRDAIDHVLPVDGQAEIDERLQRGIQDALFGPTSEPHINGVPLAVALVHVPAGATTPQHMKQAVEKTPVIDSKSRLAPPLRWQQRAQLPFRIRQVPTAPNCSPKSSLESEPDRFGNPFCKHRLMDYGDNNQFWLVRYSATA